jgi:hypothetical protein
MKLFILIVSHPGSNQGGGEANSAFRSCRAAFTGMPASHVHPPGTIHNHNPQTSSLFHATLWREPSAADILLIVAGLSNPAGRATINAHCRKFHWQKQAMTR